MKGFIKQFVKTFDLVQIILIGLGVALFAEVFSKYKNNFFEPIIFGALIGLSFFIAFYGFYLLILNKKKKNGVNGVDYALLATLIFSITSFCFNLSSMYKMIFLGLIVFIILLFFLFRGITYKEIELINSSKYYFAHLGNSRRTFLFIIIGLCVAICVLLILDNIKVKAEILKIGVGLVAGFGIGVLAETIFAKRERLNIIDYSCVSSVVFLIAFGIYFFNNFKIKHFIIYVVALAAFMMIFIIRTILFKGDAPARARYKLNRYYSNFALKNNIALPFVIAVCIIAAVLYVDHCGIRSFSNVIVISIFIAIGLVAVLGVVTLILGIKKKEINFFDYCLFIIDIVAIGSICIVFYQFTGTKLFFSLFFLVIMGELTIARISIYETGINNMINTFDEYQGSNPYSKEEYDEYLEKRKNRFNIVQDSYFDQKDFGYNNTVMDDLDEEEVHSPNLETDMLAMFETNDHTEVSNPFEKFFEFDSKNKSANNEDDNDDSDDDIDDEEMEDLTVPDEAASPASVLKRNFQNKMKFVDDKSKYYYSRIKNEFLKYRCHNRISQKGESFRNKGLVGRMSIGGKTLKLYLAIDPLTIDQKKYHHRDVSTKKQYQLIPCLIRIKSDRALTLAIELISYMMDIRAVLPKKNYQYVNFVESLEIDGKDILEHLGCPDLYSESVSANATINIPDDVINLLPVTVGTKVLDVKECDVYLDDIARAFDDGDIVNIDTIRQKGIVVKGNAINIKARGVFNKKITIYANYYDMQSIKMLIVTGCFIHIIK